MIGFPFTTIQHPAFGILRRPLVPVRPIGPAVSWLCAIGMIPARLSRPSVGLIPTTPQVCAGQTTEPSVSVPMETVHRSAATAAADPELEPHGLRFGSYGFRV